MGYGLSPALAELAAATGAKLLITVDSGIASNDGVAHAQSLGLRVLITDHHLAGSELPAAEAIVNPNQPACGFASKNRSEERQVGQEGGSSVRSRGRRGL